MSRADQTPAGWDRAAGAYEEAMEPFTAEFGLGTVEVLGLGHGTRLLDVGGGPGGAVLAAARARGAAVVVVDFSSRMMARAYTRYGERLAVAVMDGQRLGFRDDTFDAATSVFAWMFFSDRSAGLAELRRVVKPGGLVAVTVWAAPQRVQSQRLLAAAIGEALPGWPPAPAPPWAGLTRPAGLEAELAAAGLEDVALHVLERAIDIPSPRWLWDRLPFMSPVSEPLFAHLSGAEREALGEAFVRLYLAEVGSGRTLLSGEALLGIGRVPQGGTPDPAAASNPT